VAEVIYPKGTPCQINEPNHIETDQDVGLALRFGRPHPESLERREFRVIEAEVHNLDCAEPFREKVTLTVVQEKELSRWLTKRVREANREEQRHRVRSFFGLKSPTS
jgi:hypothetical protein